MTLTEIANEVEERQRKGWQQHPHQIRALIAAARELLQIKEGANDKPADQRSEALRAISP